MKRRLKTLTTKFVTRCILVMMLALFSVQGIRAQSSCATMPDPAHYTKVGADTKFAAGTKIAKTTGTTQINGVTVTRILENDRKQSYDDGILYSNGATGLIHDASPCGKDHYKKTGYPIMDSSRARKITYRFSKPILNVEVFLAEFGYNGNSSQLDYTTFSVNKGTMSLSIRKDCNNGASLVSGGKVISKPGKTTDVNIGITSTEPFTELTLVTDNNNKGFGFYVEICLESLNADNSACDVSRPHTITDPFAGTPALVKTAVINGVTVTRTLTKNSTYSLPKQTLCGVDTYYPANLPLVGGSGSSQFVYEFDKPINNLELLLYAFGDENNLGTFDQVEFEVNGGGTLSLEKTFECNSEVANISGKILRSVSTKISTDVGIRVISTKPFTKITLTDKGSTAFGYLVTLCPASVKASEESYNCTPATIGVNFPNQRVATVQMNNVGVTRTLDTGIPLTTTPQTSNHCGTNVNYNSNLPLLIGNMNMSYDFSTPIQSAEIFLYFFGDNLNNNTKDKVKFTVNGGGTVSLTNVYECNPGATIINGLEVESVTKKLTTDVGIRVTSTAPFTRITLTDVNSNGGGYYVVICPTSIKVPPFSGGQCSSGMPTPLFDGTNTATVNGIQVAVNRPANSEITADYTTNKVTTCQVTYKKGTTFLKPTKSVTYKFSQPVNNVEVKMALMGANKDQPYKRDAAEFTTNCTTTPTLSLVSDCVGNAAVDNNIVWADGIKGVDVGVKVTSAKPFTELTITDVNSEAGGYFVDLCPASIKKQGTGETDPVTITTQLTATTTACVGFTTSLTTQATLASPFTGNLNYQWQKSTNNGTTWSDISGQTGNAASGANVTYSFVPVASDNNALYRVVYTYTHAGSFCGTMSLTTDATKLVLGAVSSVITVNAPAYTDVAVCASATGTTTITAKATLNAGMGGTILTYQLQYRPTITSPWVDHTIQKYTSVPSGGERILTIENVASNTGYYRVKYTSNASVCGGGESYSNIFKFDALTATNVITITPTTYPNKVVCTDGTFTIAAHGAVATGTIRANNFSYTLEYKANSSANWVTYALPNGGATQTYSNNPKAGTPRTFTINTTNVADGGKFRVKYNADVVELCDDITVYSDEFTVTKASVLNNITEFYATPATLNETGATNVAYIIKGVPGTQLLLKFNNGAATAASILSGGVLTVTHNGQTTTATLAITQVANGTCTLTTNYLVEVGRPGGACTSFPSPQFAKAATAAAQIGGLTVTRAITGTPQFFDAYTYESGQM